MRVSEILKCSGIAYKKISEDFGIGSERISRGCCAL